jgi:hypothetical protein
MYVQLTYPAFQGHFAVTFQFICEEERDVSRGGGLEYLHRNPASRRRRRKGDPVPGTRMYNWATLSLEVINTET